MRTRPTGRRAIAVIVALGAVTAVAPGMTQAQEMGAVAGSAATAAPSGPGCASIPADGDGSFAGMADDPAATAAANNPELSTLVAAIGAAGLTDTLNGSGPFTIFAPNNAAFETIPTNVLDSILADAELLTSILTYHVVSGESLDATALADGATATTVNGAELQFTLDGETLMINGDEAAVVCADIAVANGTVHIIDTVLQPPSDDVGMDGSSVPSSGPDVTAVATPGDGPQGPLCATLPVDGEGSIDGMSDDPAATAAANNPELSTLTEAITAAGLTDTLNGEGPFTVFAPANSAFAEIPAADLQAIMSDTGQLTSILGYHVIEGEALTAADLAAAGTGVTLEGGELTFSAEADGSLSINAREARVGCSNIVVGNGIVHIIDGVLVPPLG